MQKQTDSSAKTERREKKSSKKEKMERAEPWGMTPKEGADDDNPAM